MKAILFCTLFTLISISIFSQVISTNRNPVGLESNILFKANSRYVVSATNFDSNYLSNLFDGSFNPIYNSSASSSNPSVILIEGLPEYHVQAGAWVGWTTRYCPPVKFKIEAYDGSWVSVADYSSSPYYQSDFLVQMPSGVFTKIRYTFYEGGCSSIGISFGISELYFIHPEAATPYSGLFETVGSTWNKVGDDLSYNSGNILIGKTTQINTAYKLDVAGKVRADEIIVNTTGADFVFDSTYKLRTLPELETFIKQNKHLPEIAPAKEMQENGVSAGEMQAKLLQKIEELTLYVIEQQKKMEAMQLELDQLKQIKE
jgi:hypothetical protein